LTHFPRDLVALVVGIGLVWPKEAHLSQVHIESVALADALPRAGCVVVGTLTDPAFEFRQIEVPLTGRTTPVHFPTGLINVTVDQVLRGTCGVVGQRLVLGSATLVSDFEDLLEYETSGVRVSPIHHEIPGEALSLIPGTQGVFLIASARVLPSGAGNAAAWEALAAATLGSQPLLVGGAALPRSRLAEVVALMAAPAGTAGGP
jgi:hypothetical protein